MAKIYSSVDDNLLNEIETDIREFFKSWVGSDVSKIKLIVKHINLYKRLNSLENKLCILIIDKEEELRLRAAELDCERKWHDVLLTNGYDYVRTIIKFVYFVNSYGFRRLTSLLTFVIWLKSKEGAFNYYECRY